MEFENPNVQKLYDILNNGITLPPPPFELPDYSKLTESFELSSSPPIFALQAEQMEQINKNSKAHLVEISEFRKEQKEKEIQSKKNKWKDRFIGSAFTISCALIVYIITNFSKMIIFFKSIFP